MKQILKQTSWLILAQAITRIISFFYTIYLAQNLGVSDFGFFIVALSYFSIVSAIADFGFNRFLIREIAQDKLKTHELLWNVAILRLTLTSILFAIFGFFLYIFDPDKMRVSLILLATLAILPQAVGMTFDGIFIALRKLQYSALALFLSSFSNALIGIFLITRGFGSIGAINALIVGQLVYALVLLLLLSFSQGLHFPPIKLSIIKKALIGSLPYGILGVLGLLYFKVDAILLSYIRGEVEVGIYGAAYRFLEAVIFIPSALATALFPIMARLHDQAPSRIRNIYFSSIKLMGFFGVLIAIGYALILPEIIKFFLPNYLPSIEAIKILALAIPFVFIHVPGAQVLLSTDKYLKSVFWLSVLTLSFNVVLNLIFIPQYGYLAAAWVTVASEILTLLVFFNLLRIKVLAK